MSSKCRAEECAQTEEESTARAPSPVAPILPRCFCSSLPCDDIENEEPGSGL